MRHSAFGGEPSREELTEWFRRARARTRALFELITHEAYYERPIPLRNPIVFYEGHLPAFAVNTLVKLTLKEPGIDERFETLFARGIDPEDEASAKSPTDLWPSREEVQAYGRAADALFEEHVFNGEAAFTVIEHELMHQETLMYLFHALDVGKKRGPSPAPPARPPLPRPARGMVRIPAGDVAIGQDPAHFGWDNEFPIHTVRVPEFEIATHNVTNGEFVEFVEATGARPPHFLRKEGGRWYRRTMFGEEPVPEEAPVYVTHEDAVKFASWRGSRLPTEAEWHRAAAGATPGNVDFQTFDPIGVGQSEPSDFGVYDLMGNGWEWTSSLFAPFDGFKPMASYLPYSTDFFDGAHYVLKGASPVTPRELVRPSFRNWFRPNYPWVFATFRLAR